MKSLESRATSIRQYGRRLRAFSGLNALAVAMLFVVGPAYAQEAAPRRIDDVLQVLDHYKPDPEIARRARRALDRAQALR